MSITMFWRRLRWCAPVLFALLLAACGGGKDSDPAVAPTIDTPPAAASATEGESASFSVAASGTAPLSYQWQRDGADIAGATAASYTTPPLTEADNGAQFSVVVSNSAGSVTSSAAVLTALAAAPPTIVAQPSATSVVAPATASFSVGAQGSAPLAYQWTRNGAPIAGATAASYTTPATSSADDGALFAVVVSNARGEVTSAAAALTVSVAPASNIAAVHHSGLATFVLMTDGTLYAKGSNASCRIGDGTNLDRENPVSLGTGWRSIAGTNTVLAIKTDGSLWGWGSNGDGQIGDGSTSTRCEPRKVGDGFAAADVSNNEGGGGAGSVAVKLDGTLWVWGRLGNAGAGSLAPMQVGSDADWAQAVSGDDYALALKKDGSLWAFGHNDRGQLGLGFTEILTFRAPTQVAGQYKAIGAGYNTSYAVSTAGELFAWGWNVFGMLGDDTNTDRSVPTLIGTGYAAVDAATDLVVALRDDGTVWAWGANRLGEVGDGTTIQRIAPVQVGSSFASISMAKGGGTIGIARDRSTWGWGVYDFDRDARSGNFLFLSSRVPVRFDYFN